MRLLPKKITGLLEILKFLGENKQAIRFCSIKYHVVRGSITLTHVNKFLQTRKTSTKTAKILKKKYMN